MGSLAPHFWGSLASRCRFVCTYRYFKLVVVRKALSSIVSNGLYARFLEIERINNNKLRLLVAIYTILNSLLEFLRFRIQRNEIYIALIDPSILIELGLLRNFVCQSMKR